LMKRSLEPTAVDEEATDIEISTQHEVKTDFIQANST